MATDFYREVSAYVKDDETRALIQAVLKDTGQAEFAVARVQGRSSGDRPARSAGASREARRSASLVGEALIRAARRRQRRSPVLGGCSSATDNHTARMQALGLQS